MATYFLHDVDAEIAAEGERYLRSGPRSPLNRCVTSRRGQQSGLAFSLVLTTASSRPVCSAWWLVTDSASSPTCFRVVTCSRWLQPRLVAEYLQQEPRP
jgi:hypothetical protein